MMRRRTFLTACAGALAGGALPFTLPATARAAATPEKRPPNFILILADDLGYGDLACYGHPSNATPHLDRLAREGMRFTDFHANGPMCSATRAALLTGRYQHRLGRAFEGALSEQTPETGLPTDAATLPRMLKDAGYATAMYGKWHLGYRAPHLPSHFGFDDFRGLLTGDGDHISHLSRSGREDWYHNDEIEMEEGYSSELVTRHTVEFMRENRDRPFFIYAAHLVIHFPWQAPGEAAHREAGTDYWNPKKLGPHPEGAVAPVVGKMVSALDDSVGAIMAALRELGLEDNTFVLFASDNGGYRHYEGKFQGEISRNDPCRGQKTEVWEGGHRVPAIAWWPGRIPQGIPCGETAMTMDLLPTYAALAGAPAPGGLDGTSLLPVLFGEKGLPARDLFWRIGDARAVRRGPWKLVAEKDEAQLFNLDEDIGEQHDLSAAHGGLKEELLAALRAWEEDVAKG